MEEDIRECESSYAFVHAQGSTSGIDGHEQAENLPSCKDKCSQQFSFQVLRTRRTIPSTLPPFVYERIQPCPRCFGEGLLAFANPSTSQSSARRSILSPDHRR